MASFTKLASGSWRVQVRHEGRYVSESFQRREDAALGDRHGGPDRPRRERDVVTVAQLINLHVADLWQEIVPIEKSGQAEFRRPSSPANAN
jgi:hypothetical protein